jgi:hypothetical protein
MLILEDAGIAYTIDTELEAYFGEGGISWLGGKSPGDGSFPHFFTPILMHDGFTLGTTHAVTEYVDFTSSLSCLVDGTTTAQRMDRTSAQR